MELNQTRIESILQGKPLGFDLIHYNMAIKISA